MEYVAKAVATLGLCGMIVLLARYGSADGLPFALLAVAAMLFFIWAK